LPNYWWPKTLGHLTYGNRKWVSIRIWKNLIIGWWLKLFWLLTNEFGKEACNMFLEKTLDKLYA
jgi:hypothetical protein